MRPLTLRTRNTLYLKEYEIMIFVIYHPCITSPQDQILSAMRADQRMRMNKDDYNCQYRIIGLLAGIYLEVVYQMIFSLVTNAYNRYHRGAFLG